MRREIETCEIFLLSPMQEFRSVGLELQHLVVCQCSLKKIPKCLRDLFFSGHDFFFRICQKIHLQM